MTVATLNDLEFTYVVLRPIEAGGRQLHRGDVVNVADWRNIRPLIDSRRLAHLLSPEGRLAVDPSFEMPTVSFGEPVAPVVESTEILPAAEIVAPKPKPQSRRQPTGRPRGRPRKVREDS